MVLFELISLRKVRKAVLYLLCVVAALWLQTMVLSRVEPLGAKPFYLPALVTAITSLAKGHGALSLGNVIGANLFNLVLVSGTASTLAPFTIPQESMVAGMNGSLLIDIPVMLAVMLVLCIPALTTGKLKRWQGVLLLALYLSFTAFQFINGMS